MKVKRKVATVRSNYQVKHVESVMVGSDMQARLFTLAPRYKIPWHYHSECADHYFVLECTLLLQGNRQERLDQGSKPMTVRPRFTYDQVPAVRQWARA